MKRLLCLLMILVGSALAQNTPTIGVLPDNGPNLPATCIIGQIYFRTATTIGLNQCNPANTWTALVAGSGGLPAHLSYSDPTLTVSAATFGSGQVALSGNTSGTATITGPAVAGTATNPIVFSNVLQIPFGSPGYSFNTGANATGLYSTAATNMFMLSNAFVVGEVRGNNTNSGGIGTANNLFFNSGAGVTPDVSFTRLGPGVIAVSNATAIGNLAGVIHGGNTLQVTSDFTTAANTNLQTITGLTYTFPVSTAMKLSFHCSFNWSQATGAAAVAFGIQGATTAPNSIDANATSYSNTTAETTGTLNGLNTTTATAVVSVAPSAITTIWKAEMDGTADIPSNASPTVLNFMVSTATSGDAVTVKRGSYCQLF